MTQRVFMLCFFRVNRGKRFLYAAMIPFPDG